MTEALLANLDWSTSIGTKPKRKTWQYNPPEKRTSVYLLAETPLRLAETDRESRRHLPKRFENKSNAKLDQFRRSLREQIKDHVSSASLKNAELLLVLLPDDLLNSNLEFGVTEDGYATFTWYSHDSTAAISVGKSTDIYFSTVNKNGQRMRGCKSFENRSVVFASIRNA